MRFKTLTERLEADARELGADDAERCVLVYVSERNGIILFRPGHGIAVLGGDDDPDANPVHDLELAVEQLWPTAPTSAKQALTIASHAAGKRLLGGLFKGRGDDDE
ncbi:MAG TPA: hypothetical protein VF814_04655 [Casimicrobiaceae bacterium]